MPGPPPLPQRPPPLPIPVLPYAEPTTGTAGAPVLEYRGPASRWRKNDRGVLVFSGVAAGLVGLAVFGGMADVLVDTWPDFGMALLAVPVLLIAVAFLTVSYTAFHGLRVDAG